MHRTFLPPFPPRLQRLITWLMGLALLAITGLSRLQTGRVDWLLISGGIALLIGIHRALESAVVQRWAPAGGSVVAGGILLAFCNAFSVDQLLSRVPLVTAEIVGGYIAGCYLGRMACYGRLGHFLQQHRCSVRLMPGHPDGVGGWTPLGDFFFFQAAVVAIPPVFLAVWLLLIPFPAFHDRYGHWTESYGYLLALAIAFEIGAFLLPLWSFHRSMAAQKVQLQRESDRLSVEIAELQRRLAESEPGSDRGAVKETLSHLSERYWAIEQLPEWPVSPNTRRWFGFGNLGLLVPLVTEKLGFSKEWADVINSWFSRGA